MKIKKIRCALGALLMVSFLVLPMSVFASESGGTTTLTTTIPNTHSVNLVIEGNGTVKIGEQEYRKSQAVQVGRLSEQVYHLTPDKDWQLDKAMYGTEGAMETVVVKDAMFTAPVLNQEGNTLKVTFTKKADAGTKDPSDKDKGTGVQTGDATNLLLWGVLITVSAIAIYGLSRKKKRIR